MTPSPEVQPMPVSAVDQPRHPLPAMTTFELRDYRRQLESAIASSGQSEPALRRRLDEVIAEQEDRKRPS